MLQTYPSILRLRGPVDFQTVWRKGKRISMPPLAIISCANQLTYPRLGISIAKKNIRLAVQRNRLKRLVRETFRVRQTKLSGRDIVVVVYKGAEVLAPKEQYQRLNALWDALMR